VTGNERPGGRHELNLDLPAAHRGVRVARNVVRRFARMQGIPHSEVDYLILVVSELLANVIDHGGGGAAMSEEDMTSDVRMRMSLTVDPNGWSLSVTDEGGGDVAEVNALLKPEGIPDLEDDRGRGLFLLAQMVDGLTVMQNAEGTGLTFLARKQLRSETPDEASN
jgi:anti-sigma regulatory factor (Ser/Thr protein kinase)